MNAVEPNQSTQLNAGTSEQLYDMCKLSDALYSIQEKAKGIYELLRLLAMTMDADGTEHSEAAYQIMELSEDLSGMTYNAKEQAYAMLHVEKKMKSELISGIDERK